MLNVISVLKMNLDISSDVQTWVFSLCSALVKAQRQGNDGTVKGIRADYS